MIGGNMSLNDEEKFALLSKYVNAASDLAESIELDLRKSDIISIRSIEKLSEFKRAANAAASLISVFDEERETEH